MLKSKNNISLIIFIFSLSIIVSLAACFQVQAENTDVNQTTPVSKIQKKKQDKTIVEAATEILFGEQKTGDANEKVEEEQELMENALELLEIADNYWKSGDIENTLNTLDKAYALLLDTNGDVEIARQKDDLRLLISQRILAVYSSRQTRTKGKASEIPHIMNADVEKEIRSFQGHEREFFISSYHRSGMYKELIVGELKKAGVPEELFWLPLVESGFKVSALSRARALGLWQFIPSTGYKFGLTRDEWVDERMDVLKSTHAAIAYLKVLHSMFGDWLTVLAAYNCGEGRVLRVISRQHINYFDRFWDLYNQLPNETARYVPRFLATVHIIKNPAKYGFDLKASPNSLHNYESIKVNKMMKLSDVASKLEASEDVINILNAELRYKITPNREYILKIPKGSLKKFNLVYNDISEAEKPNFTYSRPTSIASASSTSSKSSTSSYYLKHRVHRGETLASVAKRYRVSPKTLLSANRINKGNRLVRGQVIRIPVGRVETASVNKNNSISKNGHKKVCVIKAHKVKKGHPQRKVAKKSKIESREKNGKRS